MGTCAVVTNAAATRPRAGVCSTTGRDRVRNEDAVLCGPTWFAVADGMGGHGDGDIASRVAVHVLASHPSPRSHDDVAACIGRVDAAVRSAVRRTGAYGMGSTIVVAAAVPGGVAVAHVGDSRCYRLAAGALTLLTRDHSYVQELVDLGRLDPDDARRHRFGHLITRALGVDGSARPDTLFVPAPAGRLLLCSDGLTADLPASTLGRVLTGICDPQAAADRLVALSSRHSRDNVSALVVDHLGGWS